MKWIAAFLAAIVLAMPLGFADSQVGAQHNASANAISATDLHFKQIGQVFGDFVFHVRAFLTFDQKAKIQLLKERNAEMQARQQTWIDAKASAEGKFENMTAEEKQNIEGMIQTEHEAIIKEHLRLTSEIRDIQLKAKSQANTDIESEANEAAQVEEHSGLSLGLVRIGFRDGFQGSKVEVGGNVALSSETRAALDKLSASLEQSGNAKIELSVAKSVNGSAVVKEEVRGDLTAEQKGLYSDLKTKAEALVEASSNANARLEIEIKARHAAETHIDNATDAQAVVAKRLGFETSSVKTETRNGETVYVVTGTETKTSGSFELTKSFTVVVEANTGLILSADMNAHFDQTASAQASGSGSTVTQTSSSGSASAGASSSASVAGSGSVNAGTSSGSASGSLAAVGGLSI